MSQLERGDAKLADSLKLFEEGELVTSCRKNARRGRAEGRAPDQRRGRRAGRSPLCCGGIIHGEQAPHGHDKTAARGLISADTDCPSRAARRRFTVSPRAASACARYELPFCGGGDVGRPPVACAVEMAAYLFAHSRRSAVHGRRRSAPRQAVEPQGVRRGHRRAGGRRAAGSRL